MTKPLVSARESLEIIHHLEKRLARAESVFKEPVAIVGMGCRFPGGGESPESFWRFLESGGDGIGEIPADRWDLHAWYDPDPDTPGKMAVRRGGFLPAIDEFDAKFFGISPREAMSMDPQLRLFLEVAWEALEDAGQTKEGLRDSETGVYLGICSTEYLAKALSDPCAIDVHSVLGGTPSAMAGRLSYWLSLKGPSLAVDTACSSALTAVHLAMRALRLGECRMALAGGVNLVLTPESTVYFSKVKALSPSGRCASFDASADGYVRSDGCGVVVLKRLADARADGDVIRAVISATAMNQDGRSQGFTAPNGLSQQAVIRRALEQAGIEPSSVDYVETHGSGTPLGDPMEAQALGAALGEGRSKDRPLLVGSVKSNIGHTEAAAGVAGLIKTVLMLQNKRIPPSLHFKTPNPLVPWEELPLRVVKESVPWEKREGARIAGVSAFGMTGTNVHAVLREAPPTSTEAREPGHSRLDPRSHALVVLSGLQPEALRARAARLRSLLEARPEISLEDCARNLALTRSHFPRRLAFVTESREGLLEALASITRDRPFPQILEADSRRAFKERKAFLFSGQGDQYPGMGKGLYAEEPVFREALDRCARILEPLVDRPLTDILFADPESESIHRAAYTQPALFSLQYALCELWKSWGVVPDVMAGHSVGEVTAACLAGVFSLEDGLKLVAARGRLVGSLPENGAMVSVQAREEPVTEALKGYEETVALAAVNAPGLVVLSGLEAHVLEIVENLKQKGVVPPTALFGIKRLKVSHAFHSPLMEPVLEDFRKELDTLSFHPPRRSLIGNLSGKPAGEEMADPLYWVRHLREPVRFADGMRAMEETGASLFWEIGPQPVVAAMGALCLANAAHGAWLPSLRQGEDDEKTMLQSLGQWYALGGQVDWASFYKGREGARIPLPTYPFQRRRYWLHEGSACRLDGGSYPQAPRGERNEEKHERESMETQGKEVKETASKDAILRDLKDLVASLLKAAPDDIDEHTPLLEMGADSLVIAQALRRMEDRFGLTFAMRQFFEELSTLDALAAYIDERTDPPPPPENKARRMKDECRNQHTSSFRLPPSALSTSSPCTHAGPGELAGPPLETIFREQLQAMQQVVAQQLAFLQRREAHGLPPAPSPSSTGTIQPAPLQGPPPTGKTAPDTARASSRPAEQDPAHESLEDGQPRRRAAAADPKPSPLPNWTAPQRPRGNPSSRQKAHLEALMERYTRKTPRSKELTQQYRDVLADSRASAGFRPSTKEMLYPVFGERAEGSRTWDVDGNEYIDLTMGFGVNLFGHRPPFVMEALKRQLEENMQLGLQVSLSGEVARLIRHLTGMERATFCNSGTEAVMTALRLAAAKTGRTKIAQFAFSYHGHFDGTLAEASGDDPPRAVPMTSGVRPGSVADCLVLDYGTEEALEAVRAYGDQLAAVIAEPVQSRRLDFQPGDFLRELRRITRELDIPLIFDEMITGFRIHPGGAQAWFGVEADLATYGKIAGGGMPIGIVAGKAAYLDGIDGGYWRYGDDSYPAADTTFFAGTFSKHPLAMAAAHAVLREIQGQGPALQERLNRRTAHLTDTLNDFFQKEDMPLRMVRFGSQFRFSYSLNLDLLFFHLLEKGIYVWEGRNCFLSTAHTDEDMERVVDAVRESMLELRQGGFIPEGPSGPRGGGGGSSSVIPAISRPESMRGDAEPQREGDGRQNTSRYPLTEAQKQLWALSEMEEAGSLAYNIHVTLRLEGELHPENLRQAVQEVVDRHESLRTVIDPEGDFQQPLPSLAVDVPVLDLSRYAPEEREERTADFLEEESLRPFSLSQGPLFRAQAVKLEEGPPAGSSPASVHLLVLTAHHIVADGLSLSLVAREMAAFYSALCENTSPRRGGPANKARMMNDDPPSALSTCPPAPLQFRHYVQWRKETDASPKMAEHEAYWLERFSGSLPVLSLPADRPRPPVMSFRGDRHTLELSASLCDDLKALARKQGCTPFMLYYSAFVAWLHRLTGQRDILTAFPVSGRSLEGGEDLVGYCTHLLPVLHPVSGEARFADHLKATRSLLSEAYEHQDYPFALLMERLGLRWDGSRPPLASATFNLDRVADPPKMTGLEVRWVPRRARHTPFDLTLNVLDLHSRLILDFDYNSDLFHADTIARFAGHFRTLLESIAASPEKPLGELPLLTPEERHRILVEWNDTAVDYSLDRTVVDRFEEQAARSPQAAAVLQEDVRLTYAELNDLADGLAWPLSRWGVGPESLVGVCLEHSPEMVAAILAVLKAGGAYLPLDPDYPSKRLAFMIEDSGARVVLSSTKHRELVSRCVGGDLPRVFYLDDPAFSEEAPPASGPPPRPWDLCPDSPAYAIYTSGSTGKPKGVTVPHKALHNHMCWMLDLTKPSEGDGVLFKTPFSFDASVWEIFLPLLSGARLVLPPRGGNKDPRALVGTIVQQDVAVCQFVPSLLSALAKSEGFEDCRSLKKIFCGGEVLSGDLRDLVFSILPRTELYNLYGPTEATIDATCWKCERGHRKPAVPIGAPVANTRIHILDERLQPVPAGVSGEIHIGGAALARGYLARAAETARRFIPDPFSASPGQRLYKTGDAGRYAPDGTIEYLGRMDRQVKVRGFRMEPGEIELLLKELPFVAEAVVVAREEGALSQQLAAYLVIEGNRESDETGRKCREYLEGRLPAHMIPSFFVVLDALPLTPNGKTDRRALARRPLKRDEALVKGLVAPRTSRESAVAAIWAELLGMEKVGVHDHFFELGGHSLLMLKLQRRLRKDFGRSLSVAELFRHPTVSALARFLAETEEQRADDAEPGAQGGKRRPAESAASLEESRRAVSFEDIAVIGMSGRFPGAGDVDDFWRNLVNGVESITFFSREELLAAGVDVELLDDPRYVRANGVLEGADLFDASFFGYSPAEAEIMDPQHRVFLECAHEAMENAGYGGDRMEMDVGVYAGSGFNTYLLNHLAPNEALMKSTDRLQLGIANGDALTSRVSYKLDLRGPSINVQTTCSTSLVAVHLACRSLLDGECRMALAGGVTIETPQITGYLHQPEMVGSPDGHCRAFDAKAAGMVSGNGAGVVVLKRLKHALEDGDCVRAVIKSSAVNNDGAMKAAFTAPGVDAQVKVVTAALGDLDPEAITYVEAHGTGTLLGDPIEVEALTRAFGSRASKKGYCALGSVKTNVGHLDTAAGVAGLIKTVLALEHRTLPPSLHFEEPNPRIDFANSPFFVNTATTPWEAGGKPLRAGVSSFGIGGTNAHAIMEESPPREASGPSRPWHALFLSAKTESALESMTDRLAHHLEGSPHLPLADVAYTLHTGRKRLPYGRMVVGNDTADVAKALKERDPKGVATRHAREDGPPVVLLFPGLGEQYPGMSRGLYRSEPVFKKEMDRCSEVLQPLLGRDIREILFAEGHAEPDAPSQAPVLDLKGLLQSHRHESAALSMLDRTQFAHPAMFAVEYALAKLWMRWGVHPTAMAGYSLGEYVAACLSGVLALEDALRVVVERARLIDALPGGAMLAVPLAEEDLMPLMGEDLSLAAVNGPSFCVAAGPEDAMAKLEDALRENGTASRRIRATHAFHSSMMAPVEEAFTAFLKTVKFNHPRIPYASNVTGTWIDARDAADPAYWPRHTCGTVRFGESLRTLLDHDPRTVFLESGPGQTLSGLVVQHQGEGCTGPAIPSLRGRHDRRSDPAFLTKALGDLLLAGVHVDFKAFYEGERRRRVPLPAYPFQRKRYWIDPPKRRQAPADPQTRPEENREGPPVPAVHAPERPYRDWFSVPAWTSVPLPATIRPGDGGMEGSWLIFSDPHGLGDALAQRIMEAGREVVLVKRGEAFSFQEERGAPRTFTLHPGRPQDYRRLLSRLKREDRLPRNIVHLWGLLFPSRPGKGPEGGEAALPSPLPPDIRESGFYSLLFLAQAMGDENLESPVALGVVGNNVHSVTGEEALLPAGATALGPCRVIPVEYPRVKCCAMDASFPDPESMSPSPVADRILSEFSCGFPEETVAFRGGKRWVRRIEPFPVNNEDEETAVLRDGGVYVVTGGLGGIALGVARYLAQRCGAKLALVGRSPLPPEDRWDDILKEHDSQEILCRRIRKVRELQALAREVLVLQADVSRRGEMQQVLREVLDRFGEIHGVIHAAGVPGAGLIQVKTPEMVEEVFRPKVQGALVLDELLQDVPLDFLAVFSSVSSLMGELGQVDYCAANAFLDAWARERSPGRNRRTLCVNWDAWKWDVWLDPLKDAFPDFHRHLKENRERYGLSMEEGARALVDALATGEPQVVVSKRDFKEVLQDARRAASRTDILQEMQKERGSKATHPRPDLATPFAPPERESEERIAGIWRELLGIDPVGIHDNFFQLGGHSLLGIQLLSRLRDAFQVDIPLRGLFAAPTVREIGELVEAMMVLEMQGLSSEEVRERIMGEGAKEEAHAGMERGKTTYRLPNGMVVQHVNKAETDHFYRDIFVDEVYCRHGIQLREGDVVLDAGANIGLFSLFAHDRWKGVSVYAFEPAPPLFELLQANTARYQVKGRCFNLGLSNRSGEARFTYYPASTGMSSFYADKGEETRVLRTILANQKRMGMEGMDLVAAHTDDLMEERFREIPYTCRLEGLSRVMRDLEIPEVGLLKVDVQKSELHVLEGIDEEDWGKIRQIVLEVHDTDGRLERVRDLLQAKGYRVCVEQDDLYQGSVIHNVYALREEY